MHACRNIYSSYGIVADASVNSPGKYLTCIICKFVCRIEATSAKDLCSCEKIIDATNHSCWVKEFFLADIPLITVFLVIRSWLRWNMLTPSRNFCLALWRKISLQESRFGYVIEKKINPMAKFRSTFMFSRGLGLYSNALGARERRRTCHAQHVAGLNGCIKGYCVCIPTKKSESSLSQHTQQLHNVMSVINARML